MLEEYNEVLLSKNKNERLGEIADMMEVIPSLSELENSNLEAVIKMMKGKGQKSGGFSKKIFRENCRIKLIFEKMITNTPYIDLKYRF